MMKRVKKVVAICLVGISVLVLAGCGKEKSPEGPIRVGAMSGPTAMSMVKLMKDSEEGAAKGNYSFAELSTDSAAYVAGLSNGDMDIASVPSNLAANLYAKTEGGVVVLAQCVEGVLQLVERGDSVATFTDLMGKTIYATGQGAVPEYVIRYLLKGNGMDADQDVSLVWCADTTEALSYVNQEEDAIAILPQPFVTAALAQVEDLRVVADLNEEWEKLGTDNGIVTGVIVARKAFVESYPDAVKTFLEEYQASCEFAVTNVEEAAELIAEYGIVPKAPLAKKALPECHIVCRTGSDMKTQVEGFLQILFEQNPKAVGGSMPGDDFYYIGK